MSSSKKIDLKRDFAAGVYLSEAQNPPPPYTLYTWIQYTYSHREGGGGVEPMRRGEGQQGRVQIKELGWKYQHDWIKARNLPSVNSDKYLPQSPFIGQFFQMTTFCIDFYESYLSTGLSVRGRVRTFKHLRSSRIDSKEPIPPGSVAWQAGTTTLFLLGS